MKRKIQKSFFNSAILLAFLGLGACSTVEDIVADDLFEFGDEEEASMEEAATNDELTNYPPQFKLGDTFSFNNPDMTWMVMDVKGDKVNWENDSGDIQKTSSNPLLPALEWTSAKRGEGRRIISNMEGAFFPLEVGNQITFKTTVNTDKPPYAWEFEWTCDFISRGLTTVPAGTFDTYRIDCYRQKPERWSFYYAPMVGYYVKMESNTAANPADVKIRELVAYKHGGSRVGNMSMAASEEAQNMPSNTMVTTAEVEIPAPAAPIASVPAPSTIQSAPTSQVVQSVQPSQPTQPSATVAALPSGAYGVHVESFKNQANIEIAWNRLLKKYPNQLAGFQRIVRRVDLGSKGVFDRLIIGPHSDKADAQSFCKALKALGQKYCRAIPL